MFLIDKPYVSEFLLDTIRENKYSIIATKEAKELVRDTSLNWISFLLTDVNPIDVNLLFNLPIRPKIKIVACPPKCVSIP